MTKKSPNLLRMTTKWIRSILRDPEPSVHPIVAPVCRALDTPAPEKQFLFSPKVAQNDGERILSDFRIPSHPALLPAFLFLWIFTTRTHRNAQCTHNPVPKQENRQQMQQRCGSSNFGFFPSIFVVCFNCRSASQREISLLSGGEQKTDGQHIRHWICHGSSARISLNRGCHSRFVQALNNSTDLWLCLMHAEPNLSRKSGIGAMLRDWGSKQGIFLKVATQTTKWRPKVLFPMLSNPRNWKKIGKSLMW